MTLFYQVAPQLCPPTHTMDFAARPGTWSPHAHWMPCPTLGTKTSDLLPALPQFQGRGQRSWEQRALIHIPTLNYQLLPRHHFRGNGGSERSAAACAAVGCKPEHLPSSWLLTRCEVLLPPPLSSGPGDLEGSGTPCELMSGMCCQWCIESHPGGEASLQLLRAHDPDSLGLSFLGCRLG